jgi:hypothetical protein
LVESAFWFINYLLNSMEKGQKMKNLINQKYRCIIREGTISLAIGNYLKEQFQPVRIHLSRLLPAAILSFFILTGCKSGSNINSQKSPPESEVSTQEDSTPRILLVNFEINSNDSVKLIDSSVSPGTLRSRNVEERQPKAGDLIVTFRNQNGEICSQHTVSNPLVRRVEYSDDYETLQTQTIELDEAIFSVRIQYTICMKQILIQISEDQQLKTLQVLDLPIY